MNLLLHLLRRAYNAISKRKTRLFLHVGLHKTGTSAIQRFLRANANLFAEKRFYYPVDDLGGEAHHGFASKLRQSILLENAAIAQKWASDYLQYCKAHNLSLLMSSEVFSEPIRHGELAKILRPFEVNIIIYIRRQDLLIESVINEVLKGRQEIHPYTAWMNFEATYITDFSKRIRQWRETFPNANMIVRRYGMSPKNASIEIDFLDSLGIQLDANRYVKPGIVNESLNLYEFLVLRRLVFNDAVPSRWALEQARSTLAELLRKSKISDVKMAGNYFDYETRLRIMEMHAASNEQIRAEFFPNDEYLFPPVINTPKIETDMNMIAQLEARMMQELSREQRQ